MCNEFNETFEHQKLDPKILSLLPEGRCVIGNDHQFGLSHSKSFEGLFVAQLIFAGLHNKGQSTVDGLNCLLLLLLNAHFVWKTKIRRAEKSEVCTRQRCCEKE